MGLAPQMRTHRGKSVDEDTREPSGTRTRAPAVARLSLAIPIFVRSREKNGKDVLELATAVNISAGGALVAVRRSLALSARVSLEVPTPLSPGHGEAVQGDRGYCARAPSESPTAKAISLRASSSYGRWRTGREEVGNPAEGKLLLRCENLFLFSKAASRNLSRTRRVPAFAPLSCSQPLKPRLLIAITLVRPRASTMWLSGCRRGQCTPVPQSRDAYLNRESS